MKKLIFILMIFLLTACTKEVSTKVLDIPVNVLIEDHIVYWDEVLDASKYTLEINGILYDSTKNSFDLTVLGEGEYSFRIKARNASDIDSEYSSFYTHSINSLVLEIPKNLIIENQNLVWDEVDNATGYRLVINNEIYNIETNYYDLSLLDCVNCGIMIKSLSESRYKDSDYSAIIYFDKTYVNDEASQVLFDKASENDLIIPIEGSFIISIDGTELDNQDYETGNNIILKNIFLKSIISENQLLRISGNDQSYQITVNIIDSRVPFITSNYEFNYEQNDIILEFNIFDGNIESISGHNITETDYIIYNNIVTIKKEFIESIDLENIFLAYKVRNANNLSFGFILIRNGETNE